MAADITDGRLERPWKVDEIISPEGGARLCVPTGPSTATAVPPSAADLRRWAT